MHGLCTCTLHTSETLEPLTWTRKCPSCCYERTLTRSQVLCCHYWTSVNIQPIAWVVLSYSNLATVLTLFSILFASEIPTTTKHFHLKQGDNRKCTLPSHSTNNKRFLKQVSGLTYFRKPFIVLISVSQPRSLCEPFF